VGATSVQEPVKKEDEDKRGLDGTEITGGLAVAAKPNAKGHLLAVVPLIFNNELAVIDLNAPDAKAVRIGTKGIAPFGAAISADGSIAYVTNWGGRLPKDGEVTLATGRRPTADRVVVDARGIASTGSVTRIDLLAGKVTHTIAADLHPTAIVWDEARARLYVANTNRDTVSVINTRTNAVVQTIAVQPYGAKVYGMAPTALAIAKDGKTLYAACGGINAVVQIEAATGRIEGLIPTGWYPDSLALSADGKHLAIGTLFGIGSGYRTEPKRKYAHAARGTVAVVPLPDRAQLASYTTAVAENNRMSLGQPRAAVARLNIAPLPIPERAGEPSTIEHVVYIIKENRTYDQILGDLKKGNGDPSLTMYGRAVTPNAHKLAEEFVVLDNFYASGGNSADGHQWVTQANETSYAMWPGYEGRSYPFDGTDPIAPSGAGFLWDYAVRAKKSVQIFGEYAGEAPSPKESRQQLLERWRSGSDFSTLVNWHAPMPSVDKLLAHNYPGYNTSIPDVVLAEIFKGHVKTWESAGKMPNLVLLQLPSNHTHGTRPGSNSPKAMVADNDLAMGTVVDALTHSKFWNKMAIFVVEDDAQDGVDHVDGHRTVALAISPYTRRGNVDSTFYSNQSMVKTIELILGLPTMSIFDMIANDMRASFTTTADATPYTSLKPEQDLFEQNPPAKALNGTARQAAIASAKMNFRQPDRAPTEKLNRILWGAAMGWDKAYPGSKKSVFAPMALEVDDDDRK
ncbi:MAG: alkaline phosphatase family protein, partial [Bryobacteraceae bacterium]